MKKIANERLDAFDMARRRNGTLAADANDIAEFEAVETAGKSRLP